VKVARLGNIPWDLKKNDAKNTNISIKNRVKIDEKARGSATRSKIDKTTVRGPLFFQKI